MGKVTGFLEIERHDRKYEPVAERIRDWRRSTSVTVLAGILLLSPVANAQADQTEFSWSSFVGRSPAELSRRIGDNAACSAPQPHRFFLSETLAQLTAKNFKRWDSPLPGIGLFSAAKYESNSISILRCTFGNSATVIASIHNVAIFNIEVIYNRCDETISPCLQTNTELDKIATGQFSDSLVAIPSWGSGQLSAEEATRFENTWQTFSNDPISKNRFNEATNCFIPGLNSKNWRCVAAIRNVDGIFRITAIAEVTSGFAWNREEKHFVTRQSFFDLTAERDAFEDFASDVNKRVNELLNEHRANLEKLEQRQLLLNSIR